MPMFTAIRSAWALLLGLAILMLGNGLQGTLLGVRASLEGFSTQTTGYVMTGGLGGERMQPRGVSSFAARSILVTASKNFSHGQGLYTIALS